MQEQPTENKSYKKKIASAWRQQFSDGGHRIKIVFVDGRTYYLTPNKFKAESNTQPDYVILVSRYDDEDNKENYENVTSKKIDIEEVNDKLPF